MKKSTKIAAECGVTGSTAVGSTLIGITETLAAPTANLGGYATGQIVASALLGEGGPVVASLITAFGGPVAAGAAVTLGVGLLLFGGVKLIGNLFA